MASTISLTNSGQRIGDYVNMNYKRLMKSMEKLSSGLRINRGSDDPAGLVISEQLRAQIASLGQEIENLSANINKYSTADSMVGVMREQLIDIRSLAVAASNTAFNSDEVQAAYQRSAELLAENYNRQIENAEYNGSKMFDGFEGSVATIDKLPSVDFSDASSIEASLADIDAAMSQLDEVQVEIGARQKNEFESQKASLQISRENLIAAESQLRDTDFVEQYSTMLAESMKLKLGLSLMAHSQMNAATVLKLFSR